MRWQPWTRGPLAEWLIPLLLFGCYAGFLLPSEPVQDMQLHTSDALARLRVRLIGVPEWTHHCVFVTIDDTSFDRVQQRWPWDRQVIAQVIDQIQAAKPRLICVDFVLAGQTLPQADQALAASLRRAGNTVVASYVGGHGEIVKPLPMFTEAAMATGSVNKVLDRDFGIRLARVVLLSPTLTAQDYALEVKAAAELFQSTPAYHDGILQFLDGHGRAVRTLPVRADGTMPIDYRFGESDLEGIPIYQVMQSRVSPETFRDKVVFLGATGRIFHETYNTPLGPQPGIAILANTLWTLFGGVVVRAVSLNLQWLLLLVSPFLAAWITSRLSILNGLLVTLGLAAGFVGVSVSLSLQHYAWDVIGVPFLVLSVYVVSTLHRSILLGIEAARLRLQATRDNLTGVANFGYLQIRLQHELNRMYRYGARLSVVMFDLDDFKAVNDRYGHACGNDLLVAFIDRVRRTTRLSDLVARYGGDEFCAILFQSDQQAALAYAEHLRATVMNQPFPTRVGPVWMTVSIGVVVVEPGGAPVSAERLLEQADTALYQSKISGKDMVSRYSSQPISESAQPAHPPSLI